MQIYLETERMILRQFEESDRENISDLDSDPEVMKYLSNGVPSSLAEIDRAMGVFLDLKKKFSGNLGFFAAIHKDTGEFMGWFHLRPLKSEPDTIEKLELGYRLKKRFWGQGYATEGSRALFLRGMNELGAKEIWAHAMAANTGSRKVMEKTGLKLERSEVYELWPGDDKESVWYCCLKPSK